MFVYSDFRIEFISTLLPDVWSFVGANYLSEFFVRLFDLFDNIGVQEIIIVNLHHFWITLSYLIDSHQRDHFGDMRLKVNTFWEIVMALRRIIHSSVKITVEITCDPELILPILEVNVELIPFLLNLIHCLIYLLAQFNIVQVFFTSITTLFEDSNDFLAGMLSVLTAHCKINGCHQFWNFERFCSLGIVACSSGLLIIILTENGIVTVPTLRLMCYVWTVSTFELCVDPIELSRIRHLWLCSQMLVPIHTRMLT